MLFTNLEIKLFILFIFTELICLFANVRENKNHK